jgi:hypothetical protein
MPKFLTRTLPQAVRSTSLNPGTWSSLTSVCCSSRRNLQQCCALYYYSTAEYGNAAHMAVVRDAIIGSINMQPAHSAHPLCCTGCRSWTHVTVSHSYDHALTLQLSLCLNKTTRSCLKSQSGTCLFWNNRTCLIECCSIHKCFISLSNTVKPILHIKSK